MGIRGVVKWKLKPEGGPGVRQVRWRRAELEVKVLTKDVREDDLEPQKETLKPI